MPHAYTSTSPTPNRSDMGFPSRIVRCACEVCGAHCNAVWRFRIAGSCPTCGSYRLITLEGVEAMASTRLAA